MKPNSIRALVIAIPLLAIPLLSIPLPGIVSSKALAQPEAGDGGVVSSPLPSPDLPVSGRPSDFLAAAQAALARGQDREAQEGLEMAQTRLLDRSVPLGRTNTPSSDPTVAEISEARRALEARDRAGAMQSIQSAIASATAEGQ